MTDLTKEFNLDAWLDGAKRTERSVTLYARPDLLADIDVLEAKLRSAKLAGADEESLGGSTGARTLERQIDELYVQMGNSRLDLRVSFIDDIEQKTILDSVRKDLKQQLDQIASDARKEAREQCARAEIKAAHDVNEFVRNMAFGAVEDAVAKEATIRTFAAAIVSPVFTVEQVRKLSKTIGEGQTKLITNAYNRATNDEPRVTVPKSSLPSPSHDGGTSF